jgi:uncharacterized protein with PIN domain
LFSIRGAFNLKRWVRLATYDAVSSTVYSEPKSCAINEYDGFNIYDYKISQ